MRKLLVAVGVLAVLALSACASRPSPEPNQTSPTGATTPSGTAVPTGTATPTGTVSPSPTPRSTPTPTPTPRVAIPAGACLPASDSVLTWVRDLVMNADYASSQVAVVAAGEGNWAGETWNIVSFRMVSQATRLNVVQSYLTNVDSPEQPSGSRWIDIGTSDLPDWNLVSWTDTRLANGKQAQQIAFACLGA